VTTTATLGGYTFRTNPDEIRWDFSMKVREIKTIGGKVIQVLGTRLGDMTVTGQFGRGPNGEDPWTQEMAFRQQVVRWVRASRTNYKPIRFTYADLDWDFEVFVKDLQGEQGGVVLANDIVAPRWTLTLRVVESSASRLTKGISDAYISRLMDGVGWKQTDYNGPSDDDVQTLLGGMTIGEYLASLAQQVFDAGRGF